MAEGFNFSSSIDAALDFQHNSNRKSGHLPTLKLSGEDLKQDLNLRNPEDPNKYIPCAAIVIDQAWDKKPGGVITMRIVVSGANQGLVQHALEDAKDAKAEGEAHPCLYKPHQQKKIYFKNWETGSPLKCKVLKNDEYDSRIDEERAAEYMQRELYIATLYLIGLQEAGRQEININYDTERKVTCAFGQAV